REQVRNVGRVRALKGELDEAVLCDLYADPCHASLATKGGELGDGEAGIVCHDDDVGLLEDLVQRRDKFAFFRSFHLPLSSWRSTFRSGPPVTYASTRYPIAALRACPPATLAGFGSKRFEPIAGLRRKTFLPPV